MPRRGGFTDDEIRTIRRSTEKKDVLAHEYEVSRITIWNIQKHHSYAHVPDYSDEELESLNSALGDPSKQSYRVVSITFGGRRKDEKDE